jgi:flagellar basal body-associated protein FliL
MKFNTSLLLVAVLLCGAAIFFAACGGATNTASNTATANKSNTATVTNTATNTTAPANTATANTAPAGDSVGVAECDDYIKKYEACLTKIAAKAPQVEGSLKTAFEAQRNGFKTAASTPQGKATLATACKTALDQAKASTASYACEW